MPTPPGSPLESSRPYEKIARKKVFTLKADTKLVTLFQLNNNEILEAGPDQCVLYRYSFDNNIEEDDQEEEDEEDEEKRSGTPKGQGIDSGEKQQERKLSNASINQVDSFEYCSINPKNTEDKPLQELLKSNSGWWRTPTPATETGSSLGNTAELKVLNFPSCEAVKEFFDTILKEDSCNLPRNFTPEIEDGLRGEITLNVQGKHSVLAICIPYLAPGTKNEHQTLHIPNDTLKLFDYQPLLAKGYKAPSIAIETNPGIVVHKAWFLIINNDTIVTSKSKGDIKNPPLIPSPHQIRLGAFHTAITGVSEALEIAESEIFREVHYQVAVYERQALVESAAKEQTKEDIKFQLKNSKDILLKLTALSSVVDRQAKLLQELEDVFEFMGHSKLDINVSRSFVKIWALPMEKREQMRAVLNKLTNIKTRRAGLLKNLDNLRKVVIRSQKLVRCLLYDSIATERLEEGMKKQTLEATQTSIAAIERLDTAMELQGHQAQSLQDEISWQGSVLSMFTVVTVLFLPLGFFTAFFALDSVKKNINTQGLFWAISGPITFVMTFITLIIILSQEYGWDELFKPWRMFKLWELSKRSLTKQQKFQQKTYFNKLPLYRVEVNTANGKVFLKNPDSKDLNKFNFSPFPKKQEYSDPLSMVEEEHKGEFRFDPKNGWLLHNKTVDGSILYACVGKEPHPQMGTRIDISWKKITLPKEDQSSRNAEKKRGKFCIKGRLLAWVNVPKRKPGDSFKDYPSTKFYIRDDKSIQVEGSGSEDLGVGLVMVQLDPPSKDDGKFEGNNADGEK